jgi:hypothetical protein
MRQLVSYSYGEFNNSIFKDDATVSVHPFPEHSICVSIHGGGIELPKELKNVSLPVLVDLKKRLSKKLKNQSVAITGRISPPYDVFYPLLLLKNCEYLDVIDTELFLKSINLNYDILETFKFDKNSFERFDQDLFVRTSNLFLEIEDGIAYYTTAHSIWI